LLQILVCPLTKTPLEYDAARQELVSRAARLAFPIIDGLPILIVDEARDLDSPGEGPVEKPLASRRHGR
jgi:uncharacterized protein